MGFKLKEYMNELHITTEGLIKKSDIIINQNNTKDYNQKPKNKTRKSDFH